VRRVLLWLNVAVGLATLASGLAVLVSDLTVPGYRAHFRDAIWFVTAYCIVQIVVVVEFARDSPRVPWLAFGKAFLAYLFLATFVAVWPIYRTWTPGRYVYQIFEWGESTRIGLFALVFIGRGAFNTLNAFYFSEHWWRPLRDRRPLLGRLVTALPVGVLVFCLWAFVELMREEARTFSPEAQDVARIVYRDLDCDAVRSNRGKTTTDIRKRGERTFEVRIAYDCAMTQVLVRAEDGRLGTKAGSQQECCETGS
jgi:hypothetical protein